MLIIHSFSHYMIYYTGSDIEKCSELHWEAIWVSLGWLKMGKCSFLWKWSFLMLITINNVIFYCLLSNFTIIKHLSLFSNNYIEQRTWGGGSALGSNLWELCADPKTCWKSVWAHFYLCACCHLFDSMIIKTICYRSWWM